MRELDQLTAEAGIRKADLTRLVGCNPSTTARWGGDLPIPKYARTILRLLREADPATRARIVADAKK